MYVHARNKCVSRAPMLIKVSTTNPAAAVPVRRMLISGLRKYGAVAPAPGSPNGLFFTAMWSAEWEEGGCMFSGAASIDGHYKLQGRSRCFVICFPTCSYSIPGQQGSWNTCQPAGGILSKTDWMPHPVQLTDWFRARTHSPEMPQYQLCSTLSCIRKAGSTAGS